MLTLTKKTFLKNGFNLDRLYPIQAAISKYKNQQSLNAIVGNMRKLDHWNSHLKYTSLD